WDFFAVYLDSIDHFSHGFMRYHPPRQPRIGDREFELYRDVVAVAYEHHDRMLGRLLEEAGEGCNVVLLSDHGFHSDHLRPASIPRIPAGPAIEHRNLGILALHGPGIPNRTIHGASVLDIAPTVLGLFGLPVGEDMEGKPLLGDPERIPSWDTVPGADGRHPREKRLDPVAAHAAMEQMIALGYVERPDENNAKATEATIRDLRFNLAQSLQDDHRHAEARDILSDLHMRAPEETRFAVALFVSCQALGLQDEMKRIAQSSQGSLAQYFETQILIAEKRYPEALERFPEGDFFVERGWLLMRLGHWNEARHLFEAALRNDPDLLEAHLGLSRLALRRRDFTDALHSAIEAAERDPNNPLAHYLVGRALEAQGDYRRAAEAYRAALVLNPNFPQARVRHNRIDDRCNGPAALRHVDGDADAGGRECAGAVGRTARGR
ncbi:MAG: tetratricopeptide repeat protein, partial [Acidobacteriota bacterium]|nr:tetratricopeptide repeat protein [Acidobacteriota bacterium]